MTDITVKIGGEAGFGIMTTGLLLGKIATRSGYHAFEYSEYPSLIRGGHNVIEVRISDEKVYSEEYLADILVCLNEETYNLHKHEIKKSGLILYDKEKFSINEVESGDLTFINLPLSKILKDSNLPPVMMNNIALGALMHLIGADFEILRGLIAENFARKGEEIINKNVNASKLGFDSVKASLPQGYSKKFPKKNEIVKRMYITGNEMVGFGAIAAGCKFFSAYPMTPSSALLHYLAGKAEKAGMVVKHAEDEISVINMALGASYAGARSMVGTSGGGYALMVEAVSLAGITETPIVIMMGQRPGPATGMPTWTEQGDLLFIIHSGHGEFPKIVLAPGDMEESYKLTVEAFNLADIYQTPVFIMSDKYLLEGHQSIDEAQITNYKFQVDRGKLLTQKQADGLKDYKRYEVTDDGISARAIPGMPNCVFQANSYEHIENGHTTEDATERIKQVEKRNRKTDTFLEKDVKMPNFYGNSDAPLTVVSWGSMKGPVLQAIKGNESKFNFLHFSYLWPLPKDKLTKLLLSKKSLLLVENNSQGQLGQLLKMVTGVDIGNKLLKYSGRPIYPEEIIKKVDESI